MRVSLALAGLLGLAACGSPVPEDEAPAINAAAPVQAGPAELLPSLDALLTFDDPGHCIMGEALHGLIRDLAHYEPESDRVVPGALPARPAYRALLGEPVMTPGKDGLDVHLPLRGQWHGLAAQALDISYWNGGDPPAFSIAMRAPKEAVLAMLNRQGFDLPADGRRSIDEDGYRIEIALVVDGDLTRLSCSVG